MDQFRLVLSASIVLAGLFAFYWWREDVATVWSVLAVIVSVVAAVTVAATTQKGKQALEFVQLARMELQKVVWPSYQETTRVTLIVLALVLVIGLYLWFLDWLSGLLIYNWLLGV